MIVDPARDIGKYLEDAKALNLKITRVYMTHSHADFVAGHAELAKACGAKIIANEATQAGYPHKPVKDGDTIAFGNVRGVVVTTPGHTPDGTCLYVHHPASAPDPDFVLTGDTLFIGSVGRPDLMGEGMTAAALARMGFDSWNQKLSSCPTPRKSSRPMARARSAARISATSPSPPSGSSASRIPTSSTRISTPTSWRSSTVCPRRLSTSSTTRR